MNMINFENKELEKHILKHIKAGKRGLGKLFVNKITKEDMEKISELSIQNLELKNLDFLVYFPHLEELELVSVTGLQDIRGIQYCTELDCFSCCDTGVEDLSPVRNCRALTVFEYYFENEESGTYRHKERDFEFLKELPALTTVDLSGNLVEDSSFLAQYGLKELDDLSL